MIILTGFGYVPKSGIGSKHILNVAIGSFDKHSTPRPKCKNFVDRIGGIEKLNPYQLKQYKNAVALARTQKYVKVVSVESKVGPVNLLDRSPENLLKLAQLKKEQEENKTKQEQARQKLIKIFDVERSRL